MSKPIKDMITAELKSRYGDKSSALWIEMIGVDGITTNNFRRGLHAKQMRMEVVKNALFRRAVAGGRLSRLADELNGPAALLTGGDSLIEVAKLVEQWAEKVPQIKLRGAVLEGEFLDGKAVTGLSKMPTRADLQARIAGAVRAPGANLSAAILSGGARIASCIQSLIEKLEKGEAAAPAGAQSAPTAS